MGPFPANSQVRHGITNHTVKFRQEGSSFLDRIDPAFAPGLPERLIRSAEKGAAEQLHGQAFFREFALHLAKQAVTDFGRRQAQAPDAAKAIAAFLQHEQERGRLQPNEIMATGRGFQVDARVKTCPFQKTCKHNLRELGEVPQCVRAITLIQAVGARVAGRPPMAYDLKPGLVDGTGPTCDISLRPALVADLVPLEPGLQR